MRQPSRPAHLSDLLLKQEAGERIDEKALEAEVVDAVGDVLSQQLSAGVDVVSDGEQPRVGYATYVPMRFAASGASRSAPRRETMTTFEVRADAQERFQRTTRVTNAPQAIADISYEDLSAAKAECELFKSALAAKGREPSTAFMTSASPGAIASTMLNAHYDTHEAYVRALAREMRKEYELIASHGFVLQMDSPDLGVERARLFKDNTTSSSSPRWKFTSTP